MNKNIKIGLLGIIIVISTAFYGCGQVEVTYTLPGGEVAVDEQQKETTEKIKPETNVTDEAITIDTPSGKVSGLYTGMLKNGLADGGGLFTCDSEGWVYGGCFTNNMFSGEGDIQYDNGDTFSGTFENGMRNGQGVEQYGNSSCAYSGEYKDDVKNGNGELIFEYGPMFEGTFNNGIPDESFKDYCLWLGSATDRVPYSAIINDTAKGQAIKISALIIDSKKSDINDEGSVYCAKLFVGEGMYFQLNLKTSLEGYDWSRYCTYYGIYRGNEEYGSTGQKLPVLEVYYIDQE